MADILSSISVLLVFLTFLLNAIQKEITEKVNNRKPEKAMTDALRKFNDDLKGTLILKALPITIIFTLTTYILLPKAIEIIKSSKFSFWYFDILNTIFILIVFGLFGLTIYSINKTFELITKLKNDN